VSLYWALEIRILIVYQKVIVRITVYLKGKLRKSFKGKQMLCGLGFIIFKFLLIKKKDAKTCEKISK